MRNGLKAAFSFLAIFSLLASVADAGYQVDSSLDLAPPPTGTPQPVQIPPLPIDEYLKIPFSFKGSFNHDGSEIAYISDVSGISQVWKIPTSGGEPVQLTTGEDPVADVQYNPTFDQIAFTRDRNGNERFQIYVMNSDGSGVKKITSNDNAIYRLGGWSPSGMMIAWSDNSRDPRYFDVYIMNVDEGKPKMVFSNNSSNEVFCWSPNSRFLIVSTTYSASDNNLTVVDVAAGDTANLTEHPGDALFLWPAWSKGPKHSMTMYVMTNLKRNFLKLASIDIKRRKIIIEDSSPMWDTENLAISRDGREMAYTINRHGYSAFVVVDVPARMLVKTLPDIPKGVVRDLTFSPDGAKLLFSFSGPRHPWDLWLYDLKTKELRRITKSQTGRIDSISFIEPMFTTYLSSDGKGIPAYLYLPAKVKGPAACVVYIHGGPAGQFRPSFERIFLYLLDSGIAIFAPNVHGSTGYGKTWETSDNVGLRKRSLKDLEYTVPFLAQTGYIDPKRIAVWGPGYGGWAAVACLANFPDKFAAAVSIGGIYNLNTYLQTIEPWRTAFQAAEYGSMATNEDLLKDLSPYYKAEKIIAPIMMIHGANDFEVPISEANQMNELIRKHSGRIEFLVYPNEGSLPAKKNNMLDAYSKIMEFLRKHLQVQDKQSTGVPAPSEINPKPQEKSMGAGG